jgi:hypothetical protein
MSELVCNFVNDLKFDIKGIVKPGKVGVERGINRKGLSPCTITDVSGAFKGPWRFKLQKTGSTV